MKKLLNVAAWLITAVLMLFTLRRWLFMLMALLPDKSPDPAGSRAPLPSVLLLVPARNEEDTLPNLVKALRSLNYPPHRLTVAFIDDGSTDGTRALLTRYTAGPDNWHLLPLPQNVGKANALNLAMDQFSQGQIIAIYDADENPHPDALLRLMQPFTDDTVGAVSGWRAISNPLASPAASYTTFEGLVHQLVTMRAKNKLNLAPAVLGSNCAYRRAALQQIGNFKAGALLEDTDITLKLARFGWHIRFESTSVSCHRVPTTVAGYWRQHTRWARGFNEVAKEQAQSLLSDQRLSLPLRLELLTFSLGYLDRLALLGGAGLLLIGQSRGPLRWSLPLSLFTPFLQILTALKAGRQPAAMWRQMVWVPLFFLLDIAMALAGVWNTVRRSQKIWEERQTRQ